MAIRDIYETGFDEDIRTESSTNQCPECDGHVITNVKETVCENCGLVIEEQRLDHEPEWRAYDEDERERTGAPLTAARHDRGLSTEIGHGTDANGNELSAQKRRRLARMRREQTRGLPLHGRPGGGSLVTQGEVADVANVTATTIRNHYDVLQQFNTVQRGGRTTAAAGESAPQSSR